MKIRALAFAVCALACPSLAANPAPNYPPAALKERVEGRVKVEVTTDADGNVVDAKVLESAPAGVFDNEALAAAKSSRYRPTGKPEKYIAVIDFNIDK